MDLVLLSESEHFCVPTYVPQHTAHPCCCQLSALTEQQNAHSGVQAVLQQNVGFHCIAA